MNFRENYRSTEAGRFIAKIENYYGAYSDPIGSVVMQYIHKQRYSREFLDTVFAYVVQEVESQYKTPPDVARLRPIIAKAAEEKRTRQQPALPEPPDPEAAEDGKRLLGRVLECIREGADPREDDDVQGILQKYPEGGV